MGCSLQLPDDIYLRCMCGYTVGVCSSFSRRSLRSQPLEVKCKGYDHKHGARGQIDRAFDSRSESFWACAEVSANFVSLYIVE